MARRTAPPPLSPQTDPLSQAAESQKEGGHQADRSVGGQEPDRHRRNPHRQERGHESGLSPHAVSEVAEKDRSDRTGQKG